MARRKTLPAGGYGRPVGNAGNGPAGVGNQSAGTPGHGGGGSVPANVGSAVAGVGNATGAATQSPSTNTGAAIGNVGAAATHVGHGHPPPAPVPVPAPYPSQATTTVNLHPLYSSITDPAARALAPLAVKYGVQAEINPSVLLALAGQETAWGRNGQGQGHYNIGNPEDTPAQSVKSAAKYLVELGFHENPRKALAQFGGGSSYAQKVIRSAAGYTELDQAARNIENAPGHTQIQGQGLIRYRRPEDRPSARVAAAFHKAGQASQDPAAQPEATAAAKRGLGAVSDVLGQMPQGKALQAKAEKQNAALFDRASKDARGGRFTHSEQEAQFVAKRLKKAVKKAAAGVPSYVPAQYRGLVASASRESGVPASLLAAMLNQESGFDPNAGSSAGAQGIAQFMPETAASHGVDPMDPKSAIPGAAALLAENKAQFGTWRLALAAYNAGGGAVSAAGNQVPDFPETQAYVKNIMAAAGNVTTPAKAIPPQLLQRAKQDLGPAATKAILAGGKIVPYQKTEEVKFSGRYGGSKALVQAVVGAKVRGDHGGTKYGEAPGVHSAGGDHYAPNAYAQDINGDNPRENEPAYTQDTLDTIVTNIKKIGYEGPDPTGLKIGENWEGKVAGFDVQVLTNEGGTINHIHVGARNNGSGAGSSSMASNQIPIEGTGLAVQMPVASGSTGTPAYSSAGGTSTAPSYGPASGSKTSKKAAKRKYNTMRALAAQMGITLPPSPLADVARGNLSSGSSYGPASGQPTASDDPLLALIRPKLRTR